MVGDREALALSAAEQVEEPVVLEADPEFYPCACPHGCANTSTLPWMSSKPLGRHARCEECASEDHLAKFPAANPRASQVSQGSMSTEMYVPSKNERDESLEARREVYEEIWTRQWERWQESLPEKFRHAETEHAGVKERLRRLRAGEPGVASMLVVGAPGIGKTFLGAAYANAAIKAGYFKPSEVLFGSEAELVSSAANAGFGEVERLIARITSRKIKMLVIDDVGRGTYLNEAMRPKLFSLILDKYWSDNRVVVITSNLNPEALTTYLGEGAMDRLRAMVGNKLVQIDSEPKRRKLADEMIARMNAEPEDLVVPTPRPAVPASSEETS